MIVQAILFDIDGMLVKKDMVFSQRFSQEFGVPSEKILPFFQNEFQGCLVGQTDLKQELQKYLPQWGWKRSVEDLLQYWFEQEDTVDPDVVSSVQFLKKNGLSCYVHTNNEKYRVAYLRKNSKLRDLFDGWFSSYEIGSCKPLPEFWNTVHAKLHNIEKQQVFVWDDDPENILSAKNFGFRAAVYTDFTSYNQLVRGLSGL